MQTNIDTEMCKFLPVIKSIVKSFPNIGYIGKDDMEQELKIKLFTLLTTNDHLERKDLHKLCFRSLKNAYVDNIRKVRVRKDVNCALFFNEDEEVDYENVVATQIHRYRKYLPSWETSQHEILKYKILRGKIEEFASFQTNPFAKELILEMINPSDKTLNKWDEMVDKHPYLKHYNIIPPMSVARILGVDNAVRVRRIIKRLRAHLNMSGYEQAII